MRGPQGQVLRRGVTWDGIRLRVRVAGLKSPVSAGQNVQVAYRLQDQLRRQIRDGTIGSGLGIRSDVTLTEHVDRWADEMHEFDVRSWKHLKGLVVNHVLPHLGRMQVRDIGVPETRAWLKKVIGWMKRENRSPKTVRDIHRAFSSAMELAVDDEIIASNPVKSRRVRKKLPALDPNKKGPCYDQDDVWALTTDSRIRWDHRILYAGQAFGGMRRGESAGRRWRDWDRSAEPLTCMLVHTQYQDQILKGGRGEDLKPRQAPVHPAYERMLAEFWDVGWEQMFGRPPTLDDFICPDPRDLSKARTGKQYSGRHRRDQKRIGIEHKGTHAFRRYFETFAKKGLADSDMLERITHNRRGTTVDLYIDNDKLWPQLCEAVLCLKIDLSRGQVFSLEARRGS